MAQAEGVTRGWVVGRVLGARVVVQWSALVLMVFVAFVWGRAISAQYPYGILVTGLASAVIVLVSIFLHEFAHALAGRWFGRDIREIVVTLTGAHTSFDGRNITALESGAIAAAGPATNLVLALGAQAVIHRGVAGSVLLVLAIVFGANMSLAVLNFFLPGIPMDGGRVLEAIVWGITGSQRLGTTVAAWGGRLVVIGIAAYLVAPNFVAGNSVDVSSIMWAALAFSFLWPATTAALRSAGVQERVEAVTVVALMRPAIGLRHDMTVAAALAEAGKARADHVVVLSADGHPAGRFAVAGANDVPHERRDATGLAAVTIPLPRGAEIPSDAKGRVVLEHIRAWWGKTDAVAVMDEGEVVGVILLAEVGERLK